MHSYLMNIIMKALKSNCTIYKNGMYFNHVYNPFLKDPWIVQGFVKYST